MLVRFALDKQHGARKAQTELEIFTTRPDTLFGASFMAIAADHPLAAGSRREEPGARRLHARNAARIGTSVAEHRDRREEGLRHRHPRRASLRPDWQLPVYVANFVLMDYGTGAIFGCPAGDQRDLDFARKYGLPVVPVVLPPGDDAATFAIGDEAYDGDGTMINSAFLDGLDDRRPRSRRSPTRARKRSSARSRSASAR